MGKKESGIFLAKKEGSDFLLNDTLIHKGIAVMLMVAHHIFVRSSNTLYAYSWMIDGKPWLNPVMANEMICVTIFVLLSGYGINESFNKKIGEQPYWRFNAGFIKSRLLKLYTNFWSVFLVFSAIGLAIGKISFQKVWGEGVSGCVSFVVDFLGLQDVVTDSWKTSTLNPTWWFMATIILLYLAFPLIKYVMQRLPWLPVMSGIALNFFAPLATNRQFKSGVVFYFASFCLGMLCSEKQIFKKIREKTAKLNALHYIGSAAALAITFVMRWHNRYWWDLVHALAMMFFVDVFFARSPIPFVKKGLAFLGKHSSNIFMLHTFFVMIYWEDFIYWFYYPIAIFLVLLACSLGSSVILEKLKTWCGFYKLQKKICSLSMPEYGKLAARDFDKRETLKAKGIAICLLLFHHLFYSAQRIQANGLVFHWISQEKMILIATGARICVWVFAFLSAYGMAKQYGAIGDTIDAGKCCAFIKKRWLSLMKPYWLVFILSFLGLSVLAKDPFAHFGGSYRNILVSFFGLADLFSIKMPVAAWWYICFAQILILVFPFLYEVCRKFGGLALVGAFILVPFLGAGINSQFGGSYLNYLFVVILGILFAQNDTMKKLSVLPQDWLLRIVDLLAMLALAMICIRTNIRYAANDSWEVTKLFMAAAAILICLVSFRHFTNRYLEAVLAFLGKHSGNIFLIHAFTYTFWPEKIYWSHNAPVTFLTLLAVSLIASVACEWISKWIKLIPGRK